jgi:restriction endonuclease Mrr
MDVKTAAIQILQQAGTALHAKDIAEQIMAAGLWQSEGKTPDALMNGEQLVMLLMEHGIGVHRSTPDLFEIDEEFVVGEGNADH